MNGNNVIETVGLSKCYGRGQNTVHAVDGIDLHVRQGEIYGFLGLNGAGKTTTIRMLLGMVQPTAGSVRLLGTALGARGRGPWQHVGHLVETPAVYPELTTWENLEIARRLHRIDDRQATQRVIEQLNLDQYAKRKAGTLSMGNLQRLGLARALLHRPSLLILDEPANGLDPAGVVEIRALLRQLANDDGITIFMSSHILTEVDQLATRIGIIHQGRLIEELDAMDLTALRAKRLEIQSRDLVTAQQVLTNAAYTTTMDAQGTCLTLSDQRALDAPDEVAQILVGAGTPPTRLAIVQENLEAHFLQLTGVAI